MALHLPPLAVLMLLIAIQQGPTAAQWPGLWGPSRNAVAPSTPTPTAVRPDPAWRRPVSGGYSEIAVSAGRAFTMELREGDDYVVALDAATGRELWRLRVGPTYRGHGGSDDGPISTPAVEGNDVFALGPHGHLVAIDAASGTERWRHDLVKAFAAAVPRWGFAASPLIEGRLVIVPTGGPRSPGLLAFDRASGKVVWNAAVARATGYVSAVAATLHGVRQVIAVAGDRIFAVAPADGRVLWSLAGPGSNVEISNSPLVMDGRRVLVSMWEEAWMLDISTENGTWSAREAWRSPRLRSSNGPSVYRDGFIYGFAGPQLICMSATSGDVVWRERTGAGTLIAVGNALVLVGQDSGDVQIVDISPTGFTARHRAAALEAGVRAVTGPSVAEGRLYVRNLKEVVALRLD